MAWGSEENDRLKSLIERGVVDPNTNRNGRDLREYIIRVTRQHFPNHINIENRQSVNNAVRRMKSKFDNINLHNNLEGRRGKQFLDDVYHAYFCVYFNTKH